MIDEVTSFLKGNYTEVRKKLEHLMKEASNTLNFEKAIEIKKFRQISTRFRQNVRNFAVDSFPVIL